MLPWKIFLFRISSHDFNQTSIQNLGLGKNLPPTKLPGKSQVAIFSIFVDGSDRKGVQYV